MVGRMVNEEKRRFLNLLLIALGIVLIHFIFGSSRAKELRAPFEQEDSVRVEGDTLIVG